MAAGDRHYRAVSRERLTMGPELELQPIDRPGWWDWEGDEPLHPRPSLAAAVPAGPHVKFLDVSHWQNDRGRIDYAQVKAAGYVGVVAKLTEGTSFVDPWGVWNVTEAAKHGLVAGGYHFLRSGQPAAAQFAAFRAQLEQAGPVAGRSVALDAETARDGSDPTLDQADEWSELCRAEWGIRPWQYYPRWWLRKVGGCPTVHGPWWQSAYGSDPGPLICGYTRIAGWQYTSTATVPGISGNVDVNRWFGDLASLKATTIGEEGDFIVATEEEVRALVKEELAVVVDEIRRHSRLIRVGDAVGSPDTHDFSSIEGVGHRVGMLEGGVNEILQRLEALALPAGDPQATVAALLAEVHARTAPPPPDA